MTAFLILFVVIGCLRIIVNLALLVFANFPHVLEYTEGTLFANSLVNIIFVIWALYLLSHK